MVSEREDMSPELMSELMQDLGADQLHILVLSCRYTVTTYTMTSVSKKE